MRRDGQSIHIKARQLTKKYALKKSLAALNGQDAQHMHEEYYQSAEDQWRTVCALYNPNNWTKKLIADPTLFYRLLYDGNSYRS